ncbi:hypothetical protein [Nocardiopsis tropica]|uniref:CGNR zinc finger domain-containing protein n=1 Tax=Nocardiopsis tropica TaxID=109330 RepID=A0ABU7KR63_9ACTN|nr:hypothetical protein [Nocardiopsis umidischolae]MEE2051771.1 hypothetical protein [Nocardiopsis umidischolae]
MSRATTTATARPEEPTTVNTFRDLANHPAVRAVRADIAAAVERHATLSAGTPDAGPERVGRALAQAAQALEEDPALCLDPQTPHRVDLVAELVRQLRPLSRQAALVAEAERLEQDAGLTEPERYRALVQLGKLNPTAPAQVEELAVRAEEIAAELRAQAAPGQDSPEQRRALAGARLDRRTLAEAADLLRRAVRDAAAIAPDLPEVAAVLAAAAAAEQAAAPTGAACAAPGCAAPLPAAESGRVRRYCSPPCRTRARRAAANG